MQSSLSADHLNQSVLDQARKEFARISVHSTVGEALAYVQQSRVAGPIVYFYVVDDEDRLEGVVPARALLLNPADTPIAQIMVRRVIALPATATLMDACEMFMLHRLLAFPVVDRQRHILGVVDVGVYTDEIIDMADREQGEAVFQLIGVRLAQVQQASVLTVFRRRFPWLLCSISGGLACAFLAGLYQNLLQQMIILTLFFPVVLGLAESVSIQSLTLTLQAHHGGRVRWWEVVRGLVRELPIGGFMGLAGGGLIALVAWLWRGQGRVAACMLMSVLLSVITATLFGRLVPAVLRSIQRDPKVASGPITLALADVTTLFYFLGLAAWWLVRS